VATIVVDFLGGEIQTKLGSWILSQGLCRKLKLVHFTCYYNNATTGNLERATLTALEKGSKLVLPYVCLSRQCSQVTGGGATWRFRSQTTAISLRGMPRTQKFSAPVDSLIHSHNILPGLHRFFPN